MPDTPLHRHWFAFHRHPEWHGHCDLLPFDGIHLLYQYDHRCDRWHFHSPFRHRHTETGR